VSARVSATKPTICRCCRSTSASAGFTEERANYSGHVLDTPLLCRLCLFNILSRPRYATFFATCVIIITIIAIILSRLNRQMNGVNDPCTPISASPGGASELTRLCHLSTSSKFQHLAFHFFPSWAADCQVSFRSPA